MNDYPTRQEFNELKEEVRQLKEQRTEEMKVTRIEVASEDVIKRLNKLESDLNIHSDTWLRTLQENFQESRADILALRESQADLRDRLNATATKEDLSKLERAMATKGDLSKLEGDISVLKGAQGRQEQLLQEIINRLPPKA